MSIAYKWSLKCGGTALAVVSLAGVALNDYTKMRDPLSEDKFDTFVLQTTATASAAYSGVSQFQDMITGNVFHVVYPMQDRRASALATDVSGGSNLPTL